MFNVLNVSWCELYRCISLYRPLHKVQSSWTFSIMPMAARWMILMTDWWLFKQMTPRYFKLQLLRASQLRLGSGGLDILCGNLLLKVPWPFNQPTDFWDFFGPFCGKYLLGTSYIASGTRPRQMVWPQAPTGPDPQDLGVDSKTDRTWQEANRQQERNRILARAAFHRHACRLPERHNQPLKAFGWVWESEAWQVHCKC